MGERLNKIFKIMSFYDDFRWKSFENYNLINFFKNDLTPDIKILTHWLCYIADRQMSFQRIWDIGGFVFSEMIYQIKEQNSLNLLNPENENSFIKKEVVGGKYFFISKSNNENNDILAEYTDIPRDQKVEFKSRFLPADYFAILCTFVCLANYQFSFSKFINEIYSSQKDEDDFIKRILFSLYLLTYYKIGQPKSSELMNFNTNLQKAIDRKVEIENILNDLNLFNYKYKKFLKKEIFHQKRAWCSLRDFLKSPEFKEYFKSALSEELLNEQDFEKLFSSEALYQLELPGDVWNNNDKFRDCILKGSTYEDSKKELNKILREYFNENTQELIGYPEQFDITFDFVPRMCDIDNCDVCPINRINDYNNLAKICIGDLNKFCPVIMIGCNYKNNCIGKDECKLCMAIYTNE